MKRTFTFFMVALFVTIFTVSPVVAQEEEAESPFSVGADVVSTYVWRGTKFSGPAIQPTVSYKIAGLTVGAWGSYDFAGSYAEADLYLTYGFDFGLTIGASDYYYPGSDYFEYGDSISSHAFEANVGYTIKGLTLSGNYIFNNSINGAASIGGDMYFEAKYAFKNFEAFVGAGNGWHSAAGSLTKEDGTDEDPWDDDKFGVCNVGVSASKEIKFTDSFSLPAKAAAIWNPEAKDFNIVFAVTF